MTDGEWLTAQFEQNRPRLEALAYRMLGSRAEAEDTVQETWIRLSGSDTNQLDNLGGWLTTVVSRICLDRLRRRRSRPEEPIGAAPVGDAVESTTGGDPASQAVLAESVGAALLVVLDLLAPAERVAFVLHDVFAVPFDEIAPVVGRSPDAARQLASRARRRVQGATPAGGIDLVRQRQLVEAFLHAAQSGNFDELVSLLDPDVVLQPDAAAVKMGSLRETRGAVGVASALSGGAHGARLAIVDGVAGLVWSPAGRIRGVIAFTIDGDRITALDVIGDAQRLQQLEIALVDA